MAETVVENPPYLIVELEDGETTVYSGNYSEYVAQKDKQLHAAFEKFKGQQKKISSMQNAISRFREWGRRSDNPKMFKKAANMEKRLLRMEVMDRPTLEPKKLNLKFNSSGFFLISANYLFVVSRKRSITAGANCPFTFFFLPCFKSRAIPAACMVFLLRFLATLRFR